MNSRVSLISRESTVTVLFFFVAASLFVVLANVANASPHRDGGGFRHMERMADKLNLNDEQRQQLKQIHRQARPHKLAIRDAMQDNREAMQKLDPAAANYSQQVEALADERAKLIKQMIIHKSEVRSSVYAVLTPEQRQLKKEMRKNRHKSGSGHRGDHRGPGKGQCRR